MEEFSVGVELRYNEEAMLNNEQRILTPEEIRAASDHPSLPG